MDQKYNADEQMPSLAGHMQKFVKKKKEPQVQQQQKKAESLVL